MDLQAYQLALADLYTKVQADNRVSVETLITAGTWHLIALFKFGREHELTQAFRGIMDQYRRY